MPEILALSADSLQPFFDEMVDIYAAAFAMPPYNETPTDAFIFSGRLPFHANFDGFRCVVARNENGLVGFAYGYNLLPDAWWPQVVTERMPSDIISTWLSRAFEFVELAVLPAWQGQGIGGKLHDALLRDLPHRTAVLSTPQEVTRALHLYQKRGWTTLLENFYFPGVDLAFRIMGKTLENVKF